MNRTNLSAHRGRSEGMRFPYRWRIVALLFFLSVINYLDRQTLSVLAPTLRGTLGFSAVEYSYIVTGFLTAYALGYLFCGSLIDRLGVRIAVMVALSFWSLACAAHALATGWIGLLACRFFLGLGESFNAPSGMKALAEWTPKRERGLSTAIFSNGNIWGAVVAPPLVSFLALRFGWQSAFLASGAIGLSFVLVWFRHYHAPERHPRLANAERDYIVAQRATGTTESTAEPRISFWRAIRHPAVLSFFVARLLTDSLSFFFSFWLPEYLQTARGFSLSMIGLFGWIPFLAADIGGPTGGAISDWLVRRGWTPTAARRRLMLCAACVMPCSILAVHAPDAGIAIGLIAAILAAQSCWMANVLTLIAETFPRAQVGTYLSVASLGGAIGGIVSTLAAGRIISTVGFVPIFTVLGGLHLIAFAVIVAGTRATQVVRE